MERPKKEDYKHKIIANVYYYDDYSKDLEKYIDYLESKEEWISVKDRLPDFDCSVFIYDNESGVVSKAVLTNDGWYSGEPFMSNVTHWLASIKPPIKK